MSIDIHLVNSTADKRSLRTKELVPENIIKLITNW